MSHVVAWDTRYVSSHLVVASTIVSTWHLPRQVWESVIKSICQASPYLHFNHCKTREALPAWPAFPSNPTPRSHRPRAPGGCYKPHTIHGLQPWSQGLGSPKSITRDASAHHMSHSPPWGRGLALGSWWHGMVQLPEALEIPLGSLCNLKTSVK